MNVLGYETKTTFMDDFTIAEVFGMNAIKNTCHRALAEWKHDYIYLTELVMVLSWRYDIWYHYKRPDFCELYANLYHQVDSYACKHLKGTELAYYYDTTD